MARELFAIASMVVAAAALIGFFDFIDRNIDDTLTLGEAWGDVPHVPPEATAATELLCAEGGVRGASPRPSNASEHQAGTSTSSRLGTGPK